MSDEAAKWDARYRGTDPAAAAPAQVLTDFVHLLPQAGTALELACGLGANALFLARRGLHTTAWDLSPVAIARLTETARQAHLPLEAQVRDVLAAPPLPEQFDVIVVTRFLERSLCPAIAAALRPGGLLFYQTFVREAVTAGAPHNPAFRLARNELLHLFPSLTLVAYREEARLGDLARGLRDEAALVAQRPLPDEDFSGARRPGSAPPVE